MYKRLLTSLVVVLIVLALPVSALAQDYYFSLDKEVVHVYWNSDGTMSLDYLFTFTNQPNGHTIEFVDVGMPNGNFDFGSITADIDGKSLSISRGFEGTGSDGFAVEMGPYAIPPGQSGTVHVYVGRIERVLYPDSDDETYASAVFAPATYISSVVTGSTDLSVTFHLPAGVMPDEPKWHGAPSGFPSEPETGLDSNGHVTYTWRNSNANPSTQYKFGASFPASYVPADAIITTSFFDSIFDAIGAVIGFVGSSLPCLIFAAIFLGSPILSIINSQRRKLKYLPPKISIEGHGIKRGLTAVEAAILMEQPLDKVMTMILFGVIKKGAAEVVTRDPLKLKTTAPLPDGLHEYEKQFLQAFRSDANLKQRRVDLQDMTIKLVKAVSGKMKGFSHKETVAFYKNIMERAWQQIAAADTPEVQSKLFDEAMEWTMLDKDYDERTRRTFTGPIFVPMWWGRYDPGYGRSAGTARPVTVGGPAPSSRPTSLPGAEFAASVVGGVQNFSQKVIGNVGDFTSRVTNTTNPPPPPSRSSGGSRSGGGCACACACAGCACACAGGGR